MVIACLKFILGARVWMESSTEAMYIGEEVAFLEVRAAVAWLRLGPGGITILVETGSRRPDPEYLALQTSTVRPSMQYSKLTFSFIHNLIQPESSFHLSVFHSAWCICHFRLSKATLIRNIFNPHRYASMSPLSSRHPHQPPPSSKPLQQFHPTTFSSTRNISPLLSLNHPPAIRSNSFPSL